MKPRKYNEKVIEELKDLRKSGRTISEIMKKLDMPKTTVWHHIQGMNLNKEAQRRISSRRGGSRERRKKREREAQIKAEKLINSNKREKVVALTMLYWAEGSKNTFSFINTDERMLRVFLNLMYDVFGLSSDRFRFTLRLYGNAGVNDSLRYWSEELSVKKDKFKVRLNDGQKRSRSKHGMCRVTMKSGGNMLKVFNALIDTVSKMPL